MASKLPSVVGIDASLTNTGLYFGPGDWAEIKGGKLRGAIRLEHFWSMFTALLQSHTPRIAIVEGYAFGAIHSRAHRIGELGGVLRLALKQSRVETLYEVPPTTLKKFFWGKGTAGKADMLAEAKRRDGGHIPSHDVADACALWHAAQCEKLLRTKCECDRLVEY